MANTILWIYIALLVVGGMIGFFKAHSKVSLITSCVAAGLLVFAAIPGLLTPSARNGFANGIMALLLVVFAIRLGKTKKFMPSGMLLIITLAALVARNLL